MTAQQHRPHRPAVCRFKETVDKLFREFRLRNDDVNWAAVAHPGPTRDAMLSRFAEFITIKVEDKTSVDLA